MLYPSNSKGTSIDGPPYDLICVGFGPASLSIAVALHDHRVSARVLFLERQSAFVWHNGMLVPDARMQISFMKDMATFRDPRSKFTFLNYLHAHNRLVMFSNLATFYPLREEFNDYLRWCASHFDEHVRYGEEVVSISSCDNFGMVEKWAVCSRNVQTGETTKLAARHVVIAVGGIPKIPAQFPRRLYNHKILHSSNYTTHTPHLLPEHSAAYRVAVVGGGQSAVEIFSDLQRRYRNCRTTLFLRQSALRPSDDSPFVNEIFDPDRVDSFFSLPARQRSAALAADRATNYSVVRLDLIEAVYEVMYQQKLHSPDPATWAHRIIPLHEVHSVLETETGKVSLQLGQVREGEEEGGKEKISDEFDLVIFGTGYTRDAHRKLLAPVEGLFSGGKCTIDRRYRVVFKDDAVAREAGIWLQGCCEGTHGLSDSLLSILAVRGGHMVDAIFGGAAKVSKAKAQEQVRTRL